MKTKFLFLLAVIIIAFSSQTYAQFDKFSFQISGGIVNPDKGLRGNNYINYSNQYHYVSVPLGVDSVFTFPYEVSYVDSSLMTRNYGAKTGFFVQGLAKINLDKYETVRLIGSLSFNAFNAFEGSKSGYIPEFGSQYITQSPINYDYNFRNFGLGLGVEVAPLSFTKVVSPFVNGQLTFNFMSATLSKAKGYDTTKIDFMGFRMGISLGAGVEFKVNPQWGIVLGAKYDFANLLFKNSARNENLEWGRTNASLNDEEGSYNATIYDPIGTPIRQNIKSSQKDINWSSFYIGVNFYPNLGGTTKKK
jgi:hypothetical protein